MTHPLRSLSFVSLALAALSLAAFSLPSCSGSEGGTGGAGTSATGAAGTTATGAAGTNATGVAGTSATGAAGTGAAGTSATGVAGTGAAGTGAAGTGAAGTGAAGTGAAGTGAAGTGAAGTGAGKVPVCLTENVMDGTNRAATNYIECDVEDQGIDFDVAANYAGPPARKPGYDPAMTPVSFTDFGTAFTGQAVQLCHPYCFKGNLTVGVEFAPATPAGLKGEVLFDFPATGLNVPIATAVGRNSLGWIYLDGPALPAGATIKGEMVLKTKAKGVIVANNGSLNVTAKKWVEFKYFPIQQGFAAADLVDVTSIGFRLTMTGTAAWSGVVYADHFQLRK